MTLWIAVLVFPATGAGQGPRDAAPHQPARPYYVPCPDFRFEGTHKLFRHRVTCSLAKRKALYVLRHRSHPPGWRCSLDNLGDGYGACVQGRRAFEFLPP